MSRLLLGLVALAVVVLIACAAPVTDGPPPAAPTTIEDTAGVAPVKTAIAATATAAARWDLSDTETVGRLPLFSAEDYYARCSDCGGTPTESQALWVEWFAYGYNLVSAYCFDDKVPPPPPPDPYLSDGLTNGIYYAGEELGWPTCARNLYGSYSAAGGSPIGGGDIDCAGGSGNGPRYTDGPVWVGTDDPYDLDGDGDGWGCE